MAHREIWASIGFHLNEFWFMYTCFSLPSKKITAILKDRNKKPTLLPLHAILQELHKMSSSYNGDNNRLEWFPFVNANVKWTVKSIVLESISSIKNIPSRCKHNIFEKFCNTKIIIELKSYFSPKYHSGIFIGLFA